MGTKKARIHEDFKRSGGGVNARDSGMQKDDADKTNLRERERQEKREIRIQGDGDPGAQRRELHRIARELAFRAGA